MRSVKADEVVRLIAVMMPVAEMDTRRYSRSRVQDGFAIACMVRHIGLKRPRPSNHVFVQLLASETIFTNYLWVEASGIQLKSAIA